MQHVHEFSTCGNCGRGWCHHCDPAPSAMCHWCNGRGYSIAPLLKPAETEHLRLIQRRVLDLSLDAEAHLNDEQAPLYAVILEMESALARLLGEPVSIG